VIYYKLIKELKGQMQSKTVSMGVDFLDSITTEMKDDAQIAKRQMQSKKFSANSFIEDLS
jgi:hypothetical protein